MHFAYNLFKCLHIVAAIIWIGGLVTVNVLNARLARSADRTVLQTIVGQNRFFGRSVVAPAAGITLLAGLVMILVSGIGLPIWVIWGLAAIIVSMALGMTLLCRTGAASLRIARTDDASGKSPGSRATQRA